ncbi:hypothetical protein STINGER_53 [Mycobacterium phage Stinger]|jgi:DNA-binding transcriptional regulator LsrR (DeoR family)|uniref:Uncharacterized protein n=1 Tax=Mycobacterium phage Stinger TaxID=1089137 RepID=G8I9H4_9CAUD|nr:HTH DNA binding protein [Mycobacterium phage Stinger]AER49368.1 hypothetical protein STINGER_53 [Mycobacterium phage Stinger]
MTDEQRRHLEHVGQQLATARRDVRRAMEAAHRAATQYHAEGVTNTELAKALGVSRQAVTEWTRA